MKAVLLNLPVAEIDDDRRQPPGGLVALATYAVKEGHDVLVCDLAGATKNHAPSSIPAADVYGISCYTVNYVRARNVVQRLRERNPSAILVAGGPHASALPEQVARDFDYVVCGEGELVFAAILDAVSRGKHHDVPRIIRAQPIENLDDLPFPEYQRFCQMSTYSRRQNGKPALCLDSSRGCDHRCRFCNSRVVERGHWRARTPESVAAEVAWHRASGWEAFRFNDDNFLADRTRAMRICELLRDQGIQFRIFARAESLEDPELCEVLIRAGCRHVGVGVESLSPVMLARMGKATRVSSIRSGLAAARVAGLTIRAYFITGFPGETNQTVARTVEGLRGLAVDEAAVYPCIPYPGSELFERPDDFGITWIDPDFSHYVQIGRGRSAGFVMRTQTFGPDQVRTWRERLIHAFEELGIAWCDEKGVVV